MSTEIMNTAATLCVFNDPSMGTQFVSFSPEGNEGKVKLFNAINSPDKRLSDMKNTPIMLADVIVSVVDLSEEKDTKDAKDKAPTGFIPEGEKRKGYRVVMIDADGVSYTATSQGIYNSICTLRNVFGTLHFDEPIKIVIKEVKTKNGNTMTMTLA